MVHLSDIALDEDVITSYLASKMDYFGYAGSYKTDNKVYLALEEAIYTQDWRMLSTEPDQELIKSVTSSSNTQKQKPKDASNASTNTPTSSNTSETRARLYVFSGIFSLAQLESSAVTRQPHLRL